MSSRDEQSQARLGERPVYLTGLIIVAVSTGVSAFAQNYWQLLIFRSLGGIGSTMFTVSAMALLVRLAPPKLRGRVFSLYGSAFLIAGAAFWLIGALVAHIAPAVRIEWVLFAGLGALVAGWAARQFGPRRTLLSVIPVFSAGILAFEMLTGRRLFRGKNDYQTIALVRACEVPSVRSYNPAVPTELEAAFHELVDVASQEEQP